MTQSGNEIDYLRRKFHESLCHRILGLRLGTKVFSVADSGSRASIGISEKLVESLGLETTVNPLTGQAAGSVFTTLVCEFLKESFNKLPHLRPGKWIFSTSQAAAGISAFEQYEHLAELQQLVRTHRELLTALGSDYLITPDIIVGREPEDDPEINKFERLVAQDKGSAGLTPLRSVNRSRHLPILHASISCKWTIRSDRAQNTRTEALNLIRNRKGKTPIIVAVTFEPLPTRLASIAMGTGDIDCTYHGALYELVKAVQSRGGEDQLEFLEALINGRRLRDISDLPFDLAC